MAQSSEQFTPYADLNAVLRELVASAAAILGPNFVGAYLQGSFAVGDFDEQSDVDFIVAIAADLSSEQVAALQGMHARIYDMPSPWAQHLEGSYAQMHILRDATQRATPLWYLDHGSRSLSQSTHCNTLVVRWVVREHGVRMAGLPPLDLIAPIPVVALRREILATMLEWAHAIASNPAHYANRFYQTYIVLNYCRMLHDLQNGFPGSKRAGADWAKIHLDPAWNGLIDRTWAGRPDPATSARQPADPTDFDATRRFVEYVVNKARSYAERQHLA